MLSLKCDHPFLCKFPILFSTEKLKLGHNFSQFIHGRVYSAGKNFTGKINPALILPVKRKFYRSNKSCSSIKSKFGF